MIPSMVNTRPSSDNTKSGRQPHLENWNEEFDDVKVNLLQTRWMELGFGDNRYKNRDEQLQSNMVDYAEWVLLGDVTSLFE